MDLTGLEVEVQVTMPAAAGEIWDLLTDVTRVGEWSPECVGAEWHDGGSVRPGARFRGHNRMNGREWSVTCVVVEAERPSSFAWIVLDEAEDPERPSSHWRYDLEPLDGGTTRVRHRFRHGVGGSGVVTAVKKYPEKAERIIAARREGLRANMLQALGRISGELETGSAAPS